MRERLLRTTFEARCINTALFLFNHTNEGRVIEGSLRRSRTTRLLSQISKKVTFSAGANTKKNKTASTTTNNIEIPSTSFGDRYLMTRSDSSNTSTRASPRMRALCEMHRTAVVNFHHHHNDRADRAAPRALNFGFRPPATCFVSFLAVVAVSLGWEVPLTRVQASPTTQPRETRRCPECILDRRPQCILDIQPSVIQTAPNAVGDLTLTLSIQRYCQVARGCTAGIKTKLPQCGRCLWSKPKPDFSVAPEHNADPAPPRCSR